MHLQDDRLHRGKGSEMTVADGADHAMVAAIFGVPGAAATTRRITPTGVQEDLEVRKDHEGEGDEKKPADDSKWCSRKVAHGSGKTIGGRRFLVKPEPPGRPPRVMGHGRAVARVNSNRGS
jgi:hypothetical protein